MRKVGWLGRVVAEMGKGETTEHFLQTMLPLETQSTDFFTKVVILSPIPKPTICTLDQGNPPPPLFRYCAIAYS